MRICKLKETNENLLATPSLSSPLRFADTVLGRWTNDQLQGLVILVRGVEVEVVTEVTRHIARRLSPASLEFAFAESEPPEPKAALPYIYQRFSNKESVCMAIPNLTMPMLSSLVKEYDSTAGRCTFVLGVVGAEPIPEEIDGFFDHVAICPKLPEKEILNIVHSRLAPLDVSRGWVRHMLTNECIPQSMLLNCAKSMHQVEVQSRIQNEEWMTQLISGQLGREVAQHSKGTENTWDHTVLEVSDAVIYRERLTPRRSRIICYGDTVCEADEFAKAVAESHGVALDTVDVVDLFFQSAGYGDDHISQMLHDAQCDNNILMLTSFEKVYKGLKDLNNPVVLHGCRTIMKWLEDFDGRIVCVYNKPKLPRKHGKDFDEAIHFGPLSKRYRLAFVRHYLHTKLHLFDPFTLQQKDQITKMKRLRIEDIKATGTGAYRTPKFKSVQDFIDALEVEYRSIDGWSDSYSARHLSFDSIGDILTKYLD